MTFHPPHVPNPSAEAKAAFLGTEVSFDPTEPRWVLADLILRTVEAVNGPGPWLQSSFYLADVILAHGYAAPPVDPALDGELSAPRVECTCPTGDGSLRWPCPVHPPLGTVIQ